ncbi:MAG TPA: DUF4139 domain-containing protein [Gemmataceae bacterium]|nr:DUF4139 domain-containing protein [Gemmataceae bacterium]
MGRRCYLMCGGGIALLALGAFVFLSPRSSTAEPNKQAAQEAPTFQAIQLPIGQVVLFSSGVGYFQREGRVEGKARVDLSFPVQDINDLLKSMVIRDLDGGSVSTVSYDSNAPIERTLKSFAVNLTANPSFAQILDQARGEKVEVVLQQTNATQPGTLNGTLIGCEKKKQAVGGKDAVEVELLNLWCADGMRSLKLPEVQRVRFLNPILDSELKKALETLALSHDTQKKSVSINFLGEGKREVRVSYVVENPIWKTSYRLVLNKDEHKPFLQGWAVVENPTDEDWKDVRMALVSGRPISFQMDLYQPLYVPRPVVEMELFASLRPVAYSGSLNQDHDRLAFGPPALGKIPYTQQLFDKRAKGDGKARALREPQSGAFRGYAGKTKEALDDRMNLAAGVSSVASAAKLGDFFQYAIDKPVTLNRQKSALLPIINKDVEGTRVSIYNERTQAKFPLLGLRFKNTSGLHLMQGPITVFEGSNYAGDARILDLQPNEERLLSYAVDLGTEVNPVPSTDNGKLTHVKAVKGLLHTTTKLRESKTYTIKNRNDQERTVLIEHPVRNNFKLVSTDKPLETAGDVYRFQVKVAPGKTAKQVVAEERIMQQTVQLTNLNDDSIRHFIQQTITSDKVKAGLQKAMQLRWAMQQTQREIAELERQLNTIRNDQPRLRSNLKELPQTSEAYKRIVKKFNDQETQIEQYQADIKKLQGVEHRQKKAFENFLAGFTAE